MSSAVNTISINSVIVHSLSKKSETSPPKWLYVACLIVGLAILCLTQPSIANFLTSYLPGLNHIVGSNIHTYIIAFGLVSVGLIGLVKQYAKKTQWQKEDNVLTLFQRKRGEWLVVEHGEIKTMSTGKKILCSLIPTYRKQQNRQLKEAIGTIISQIKLNEHSTEAEKSFVKKLFFEKLAPLSRKVYKRVLDSSVLDYLSNQAEDEEGGPGDASENFQQKFKSAQIWARLGNFKRPQGGVGGSYAIIEGMSKRHLGIYKPHEEDTLAKNNPLMVQKIKYAFAKTIMCPFSQLAFDTVGGQAYIAEAATTKVEKFVVAACKKYYKSKKIQAHHDLEFVPETHIVTLPLAQKSARIGSFQLWINDRHQTASQFLNTSRHYGCNQKAKDEMADKLPGELFDIMVIIDYVTGNFDRHGDNWFIMNDAHGIRLIDGGWAMAPAHPTGWNVAELRNQYLWKKLPFADSSFTELGQFVINEISVNQDRLGDEVSALYSGRLSNGSIRIARMKERIQVLQKVKDTITKRALAEIRTLDSINAHLV